MKIVLDGCGNDQGSAVMLKGAAAAVRAYGAEILLTGDEKTLRQLALENGIDLRNIEIVQADSVLTMEDEPMEIGRSKENSSMAVGMRLVRDGQGDALVSAGNTGALVAGSSLIIKRLKGVRRAAITTTLPTRTGRYMLLDAGANVECRAEMLAQFAIMGSIYAENVDKVATPRVGMINIGVEKHKGTSLVREANALLETAPIHFVGNVEAKELNTGGCDVAVTDGFTGNVILKLSEGMAGAMMGMVKDSIMGCGARGKMGAALLKPAFQKLKRTLDASEIGGAPLLGIAKPVIKAHGNSGVNAVKNAVHQAMLFAQAGVNTKISETLALWKEKEKQEEPHA